MGKVVITGANRGIGLALTEKFLKEGHDVVALCRKASSELAASQAQVIENIDVTDLDCLKKISSEIEDIDILINNAGVLIGDQLENIDFDNLQKQVEVNTFAPLKVAMTLGQKIKRGGKFAILTSRMGSITDNTSGAQYGYRLSKAGANAVTKSLSEDFRDQNITVLALHPGYVRTQMTKGNGLIDTAESAEGLYQLITQKEIKQTGTFWHTNGEELPW
jgi:NAD(P)-dependent dehydrogenase (short-subunit alcohol dehydrogenase family)